MEKYHSYNTKLQTYARQNRNYGTKAEACLWKFILKAKKTGYQFNRQRPVLHYIADFMCVQLKLIVEVDGYTHQDKVVAEKDKIRQQTLEEHGFKVIRFTNEDVLFNIDSVYKKVKHTICELEKAS